MRITLETHRDIDQQNSATKILVVKKKEKKKRKKKKKKKKRTIKPKNLPITKSQIYFLIMVTYWKNPLGI